MQSASPPASPSIPSSLSPSSSSGSAPISVPSQKQQLQPPHNHVLRQSSSMLTLQESDNEPDGSSFSDNPIPRSYSPINSFSKKRYSNLYDNVSLSSLAAAAAAASSSSPSNSLVTSPSNPSFPSLPSSTSSASGGSALLDSLLDPNVGKNLPGPSLSSLSSNPSSSSSNVIPPSAPPSTSTPILNKKPSWYAAHSRASSGQFFAPPLPNQSLYDPSTFSSSTTQLQQPNQIFQPFDQTFLPPPPLPPFAGGSPSTSLQNSYSNSNGQSSFSPSHSAHSSISISSNISNPFQLPQQSDFDNINVLRSDSPVLRNVSSASSLNKNFNFPNSSSNQNLTSFSSSTLPLLPTTPPSSSSSLAFPVGLNPSSVSSSPSTSAATLAAPVSLMRSNSPIPSYQPFNFQSTTMALAPPAPARPNQRRGHKYKHSSVSMNFFKEDVRVPLAIPASLPIPNFAECRQSMSKDQKIRVAWCVCHFYVAFLIYIIESPYTALSALAHLLFYDAMGAFLCAFVDILGNFDVWKRSSVHLPFGLERTEVLAGYALSISLIFMGGDILSHSIQDIIQAVYLGDFFAASHHHGTVGHAHIDEALAHGGLGSATPGTGLPDVELELNWNKILFRVFLGIIATVVSAVGFDNHSRIARAMQNSYTASAAISNLPWILSNPSHFMTVTFSVTILLYPLESSIVRRIIDTILTPLIASSMCYVGWILAKSLGGMLVMSFPGENRIDIVESEILKLPNVHSCCEISVWQVHHSVWLACMKIEMTGTESDEQIVRDAASRLIKDIMSSDSSFSPSTTDFDEFVKPNNSKAVNNINNNHADQIRWEITIDITRNLI